MAHGSAVTTRRFFPVLSLIALLAFFPACSSSDSGDDDKTSAPTAKSYVGLWRVTNKANAADIADMQINAGGTFQVNGADSTVAKVTGNYTEVDADNIVGTWQHVSIAGFHGRMTVSMTGANTMNYAFIEDLSSGPKTAYFTGVRLK